MSSTDCAGPVIVALGGNALQIPGDRGTWAEQRRRAGAVANALVSLDAPKGLVITHGNGPLVGTHLLRSDLLAEFVPPTPIDVAVAATQGEIGWVLQRAVGDALAARRDPRPVACILTQVLVEDGDPAFAHPTKFVGRFYTQAEAEHQAATYGWRIARDGERGWRRVVPSPPPREVIESPTVAALAGRGTIVIAGGGGGVPLVRRAGRLYGVEAVVDKDLTAALLARDLQASRLVILTGVDRVWLRFGRPDALPLDDVGAGQVRSWLAEGHFPPGSMGPKIEAALAFLAGGKGEVVITSPGALAAMDRGGPATRIRP
jgi:carbamate kinase